MHNIKRFIFDWKFFWMENGLKISLWWEYSEKYYIEIYFSYSVTTDTLLEVNINDSCQILQTKNILFWNNQVYTLWKPTPWSCSNNSYSVPVLKIIRKWNTYEKENVYFKGFLATGWQYLYDRLFETIATFSEQLLPTAWEYSMFYHLPKLKAIRLKLSAMKNVYRIYKLLKYFTLL